MLSPTAADVRAWAPPDFDWTRIGFPAVAPPLPAIDPLDKRVEWANAYVEQISFRPLSTITPEDPVVPPALTGSTAAQRPPINLEPLAEQAITLRTLQLALQGSKRYVSATVLQDYVQSFTAGSYSETRRSSTEMIRRGGSVANPQVNPWAELSDVLWLLMTDDAVAFWREQLSGVTRPAGSFAGGDWRSTWDSPLVGLPGVYGSGIVSYP